VNECKPLHTGWFGASSLVINDVVGTEPGDVFVSSDTCEAVVLDAAGCDTLAGRGLHSFTSELNLSNTRAHS
jgi:hypothetical protein